MKWRDHKAKLMKDPTFRAAREALEPEYQERRRAIREATKAVLSAYGDALRKLG